MKKLETVLDEIVVGLEKHASELTLCNTKTSPIISSAVGQALVKTAELLKTAAKENISEEDVQDFLNRTINNA